MTAHCLERLNYLVEEGIFPSRGEIFRDSLRRTFRAYGVKPFTDNEFVHETVKVSEVPRPVDTTDEKETN